MLQSIRHRYKFLLLATILLAIIPLPIHAQLTCDLPPPPLNTQDFVDSISQSFWNTTDFCQFKDGVFGDGAGQPAEIISGGVPPDGIPPIDDPTFDDLATADGWLQAQSPVIAVDFNGEARAYPLAIMTRHEIVNDQIGDVPVAVTFCPLCNSAIVYDSRIEGEPARFGVSGLLRNSDLIMWDDLTKTWWQQFTGEGIVGTHTGKLLDIIPSQVVSYGAFKEQFPNGTVLSPNGASYGSNSYVGYDSNAHPFLFAGTPDNRLFPVERILGVELNDVAVAYPFETLMAEIVINDTVNETPVAAFWQPGSASALDGASIDDSRDVGMAGLFNRELDGEVLSFSAVDGAIVDDQTGSTWNVFGTATSGELAGSQLEQINAFPHFWFAWAAFFPETEIYGFDEASFQDSQSRLDYHPSLGNPDAPVVLTEYGGYGCHACKEWHEAKIVEQIMEIFPGQIHFVFHDTPIVDSVYARVGSELAECALDQGEGQYWAFHDAMFTLARQSISSREDMIELARLTGVIDVDALRACSDAGTHIATVDYKTNVALGLGVRGTPTFSVNGELLFGGAPETIVAKIEEVLANAGG